VLLVDSVVVFRPSGSGTPARIIAPRMRQNRSRIEYSTMPLMTGILSTRRSLTSLPFADFVNQITPARNARNTLVGMYQSTVKRSATNNSIRVGNGRSACSSSNNGLNWGRT